MILKWQLSKPTGGLQKKICELVGYIFIKMWIFDFKFFSLLEYSR